MAKLYGLLSLLCILSCMLAVSIETKKEVNYKKCLTIQCSADELEMIDTTFATSDAKKSVEEVQVLKDVYINHESHQLSSRTGMEFEVARTPHRVGYQYVKQNGFKATAVMFVNQKIPMIFGDKVLDKMDPYTSRFRLWKEEEVFYLPQGPNLIGKFACYAEVSQHVKCSIIEVTDVFEIPYVSQFYNKARNCECINNGTLRVLNNPSFRMSVTKIKKCSDDRLVSNCN